MRIEPISLQPTTYRSEDGKQSIVMNANLTLDGLAAKINEIIRHTNGLHATVEALSNSIPPKAPTSPTPEEMGYIKLDKDSLRRFHESKEGQELGRRYNKIVTDRIKLDPTITAEELAEDRAKLQMQVENYNREKGMEHLMKKVWDKKIKYINDCYNEAMSAMNAIAYGDADPKHPEIRLVAGTNDTWSCRALAEKAIEKLKQSVRAASITSMDLLNEEVE